MTDKKPNFLRRGSDRYSKLGKRRKNKQTWRKPTGRDNKMREKRRGYPAVVSIGYGSEKKTRGTVENKIPVTVMNVKGLEKFGKNNIAVLGKVGKKKKIEIMQKAKEMKIQVQKTNVDKFLEKNKLKEKKK